MSSRTPRVAICCLLTASILVMSGCNREQEESTASTSPDATPVSVAAVTGELGCLGVASSNFDRGPAVAIEIDGRRWALTPSLLVDIASAVLVTIGSQQFEVAVQGVDPLTATALVGPLPDNVEACELRDPQSGAGTWVGFTELHPIETPPSTQAQTVLEGSLSQRPINAFELTLWNAAVNSDPYSEGVLGDGVIAAGRTVFGFVNGALNQESGAAIVPGSALADAANRMLRGAPAAWNRIGGIGTALTGEMEFADPASVEVMYLAPTSEDRTLELVADANVVISVTLDNSRDIAAISAAVVDQLPMLEELAAATGLAVDLEAFALAIDNGVLETTSRGPGSVVVAVPAGAGATITFQQWDATPVKARWQSNLGLSRRAGGWTQVQWEPLFSAPLIAAGEQLEGDVAVRAGEQLTVRVDAMRGGFQLRWYGPGVTRDAATVLGFTPRDGVEAAVVDEFEPEMTFTARTSGTYSLVVQADDIDLTPIRVSVRRAKS